MRMQRQGVSLTEPQKAFLEKKASELGISVSDLIRRIIDQYRDDHTPIAQPSFKRGE